MTVLGASPATALLSGVTVTVAVPRTWPCGMVKEKSEVAAPDRCRFTAVADSTAVPEANSAVTVTAVAPASSAMVVCCPESELVSTDKSMTVGAASSSVMVTAAEAVRPNSDPVNSTCSVEVSTRTSSVGVRVIDLDPLTAAAATGTVKSAMFSKSVPAVAPTPVTVTDTWVSAASSEVAALGNDTVRSTAVAPASSFTEDTLAASVNPASSSAMVREAGLTV